MSGPVSLTSLVSADALAPSLVAKGLGKAAASDKAYLFAKASRALIDAGVDAASDKIEDFFGQLFQHQEGLERKVAGMSDLTLEDSIARMTTWVRGMSEFQRK